VLALGPDDVVLSVSRMFFAYGLGNSVYLPAAVGATVVVSDTPVMPAMMRDLLAQTSPTLLFGVPAFFRGLVRLEDAVLPPSVRAVVSAGEALDAELFDRFRERFGLPLLDGLGSTEALHHVTSNRPDDVVPGSAGRALDGYEIQALDRDGEPVAEGERGELWVKGPTTFAGYWRRPELTERAYRGPWMRTGDVVRIVDGRVYHEGRLDDLVKLGGIWVAPSEIEDVVRGHPDVKDAAVVAIDDGSGVPVLKAFVVSERDGKELSKELLRLCRSRLATFKIPQSFTAVDELPRTPSGKLRRFVLREEAGQPARS
jgi:benzoate-CoA ligase